MYTITILPIKIPILKCFCYSEYSPRTINGSQQNNAIFANIKFHLMYWRMNYFLKYFIYLFMRDTERGKDRGRSRLHAGSPMQDLIPGLQDHDLSRRQMLIHWAIQASLLATFKCQSYLKKFFLIRYPAGSSSLFLLLILSLGTFCKLWDPCNYILSRYYSLAWLLSWIPSCSMKSMVIGKDMKWNRCIC